MTEAPDWDTLDRGITPILVMGNGPSRIGMQAYAEEWKARGWLLCGCNSYVLDEHENGWPEADYLVCYDVPQIELALRLMAPGRRVLCPSSSLPIPQGNTQQITRKLYEAHLHRIVVLPHYKAWWEPKHLVFPELHLGRLMVMGELSGYIAFQLAVHLGTMLIGLLGMDVAGRTTSEGRIRTSCFDPRTPGYEHQNMGTSRTEELGGDWHQPKGWAEKTKMWRVLYEWAEGRGAKVRRLLDVGALTFVPVFSGDSPLPNPAGVRSTEG